MRLFLILFTVISMGIFPVCGTRAAEPGDEAPRFELSGLGGGHTTSRALFESHRLTFLLFWESQCRHCVESLERAGLFHQEYGGGDITVVGLNTDSDDPLRVRSVIERAGVAFPQLLDPGGAVAGRYGIPFGSLALYLVDSRGLIVARSIDPEGDVHALMEEMLSSPLPETHTRPRETPAAGGEARSGLSVKGDSRIRFLGIDTRGNAPVGPYGEAVTSGNHVQYRFTIEMSKRLGGHITLGALLRISNEGREVLEAGPDYYGSEWGSAYATAEYGRFRARVGYFTTHMTPLTLMRWDWRDNPRIGGDAGCG